jgi:catechol 2,3-dioxygenase-like lactoylglutathione lyase family enzyme
MRPTSDGIVESSLYVSDLPRSVRFYEEIFGFRVISDFPERGCAMEAGPSIFRLTPAFSALAKIVSAKPFSATLTDV